MSLDRPHSPFVPACGKVGHPSYKLAVEQMRRFVRGWCMIRSRRPALSVYRCAGCLLYHVGNDDRFVRESQVKEKVPKRRTRPTDEEMEGL